MTHYVKNVACFISSYLCGTSFVLGMFKLLAHRFGERSIKPIGAKGSILGYPSLSMWKFRKRKHSEMIGIILAGFSCCGNMKEKFSDCGCCFFL